MDFTLKIWRQKDSQSKGKFETIQVKDISADASLLEMFDIMNDDIVRNGGEPVVYDHDCREGICGMCSMHINGRAHGPGEGTTTCQLYMRKFKDGQTIWIEPWRAKAFPVIKDLMVDRTAFDKINQAGGYASMNTGSAPDGNAILIPKDDAEMAMDAASCIGCGACVATCKNASAMLFVAAKVSH
ncbi:MAG: succinate dehydrogenase/fumarate reductase iron-sulfur subunit, partial [Bacteroidales bacterium]|nr:succinate dehydrogenase/fumarate reductase iron-sulfur subunit [Bacteroidales bacterium]